MSRLRPPEQAVAMCAADAGVAPEQVRLLRAVRRGRNELFVIGAGDNGRAHPYHVKLRAARHRPEHWQVESDFRGLVHVARRMPREPGFGSIRPVGFGTDPKFLLTRFQAGAPLGPLFNRAIRLGRDREQAMGLAALLGRWLAALHNSDTRPGELDLSGYLGSIEVRMDGLARSTGCLPQPGRLVRLLDDLGRAGRAADRAFLATCFPVHGDMAPQNFILDEPGAIYPVDFSAFSCLPLDRDAAALRMRLERNAFFGPRAAHAAAEVWRHFWDAYVGSGRSADACAFACTCRLIERLTRKATGRRFTVAGWYDLRRSLRLLRDRRWLTSRLRWLRGLAESDGPPADYVRSRF